jgi:hypothetical protein
VRADRRRIDTLRVRAPHAVPERTPE